jgi:hypothetical protein
MTIKQNLINEYIKSIDFSSGHWALSKMKEDMRSFLGEEPGIDVIYKKDVLLNETTMVAKEFVNIDKIEIIFYDVDNKFKKMEYKIGV